MKSMSNYLVVARTSIFCLSWALHVLLFYATELSHCLPKPLRLTSKSTSPLWFYYPPVASLDLCLWRVMPRFPLETKDMDLHHLSILDWDGKALVKESDFTLMLYEKCKGYKRSKHVCFGETVRCRWYWSEDWVLSACCGWVGPRGSKR